jgi:hypothetical protein
MLRLPASDFEELRKKCQEDIPDLKPDNDWATAPDETEA